MIGLNVVVDCVQTPVSWPADPLPASGTLTDVVGVPEGTSEGNPTVVLRIQLADGSYVFTETTLRLLQMATAALTGRYGQP